MTRIFTVTCIFASIVWGNFIIAQDENKPVIIEAESGTVGSGFNQMTDGDITYVTANTNYTGTLYPEDPVRVITFEVTFKDSGTYNLFARLRVGAGSFNDDSFFAAKGFGSKNVTSDVSWVMANGLGSAGFYFNNDVVASLGSAGSEIWKWVNITNGYFTAPSDTIFYVHPDSLTKTFQIASREDGLDIDKFAFGKANLFYRVADLDSVLDGSSEYPGDSTVFYPGPPLADGSSKFLGNIKGSSDRNYENIWNQLTPGNEGKWGSIAGSSDTAQWNWSGLDNLYNYAKENNMVFKDHTLIWGNQQPSWINTLPADQQLFYIETWIRQVGERYSEIDMVDVVNEALYNHAQPDGENGHANYKEALGGNGETGWDWVIKSFELARKYLPDTKLLINDYNIVNSNTATSEYLTIIKLLQERGLIDGIGLQSHRFGIQNATVETLQGNLDRLAETGLPIYISEMDLGDNDDEEPFDDNLQLENYMRIFPVFWEHPSVVGVTIWGYEFPTWQKTCHLVNTDGSWRPALKWLYQYIKDTPVYINIPEVGDVSLCYEAECSTIGDNWEIHSDRDASNDHYISPESGSQSTESAPVAEESKFVIPFKIDSAGQYKIYARINCPTSENDAFWMSIDGNEFKKIDGLKTSGWQWKLLSTDSLILGNHELAIAVCEEGALLDKICISNLPFEPLLAGVKAANICELPFIQPVFETEESLTVENYPNPFNSYTNISFTLSKQSDVFIQIFDITGSLVTTLMNENLTSGTYNVKWNADNDLGLKVGNGTYIYRILAGNNYITNKIILIK